MEAHELSMIGEDVGLLAPYTPLASNFGFWAARKSFFFHVLILFNLMSRGTSQKNVIYHVKSFEMFRYLQNQSYCQLLRILIEETFESFGVAQGSKGLFLMYTVNSMVTSHATVALPVNTRLFLPPNDLLKVPTQSKNEARYLHRTPRLID